MRGRNYSAGSVSERAKLYAALVVAVLAIPACAEKDRVSPVYDASGSVQRLDYDTNRDGQIDMRAYLQNGRTVRIEADGNGDGVVDRWEYYRPDGQLNRIGSSSASDGVE